jgi:hypothetical protein
MKLWTMLLLTLTGVGAAAPFDSLSLAQGRQTPTTANVSFEVASIKENKSGSPNSSNRTAGERYSGTNVSLISLLRDRVCPPGVPDCAVPRLGRRPTSSMSKQRWSRARTCGTFR